MNTRFARTLARWTCVATGHAWLVAIHLNGDPATAVAYALLAIGVGLELLDAIQRDEFHDRNGE